MELNKSVKLCVTFAVIFFLTFLGMRIAILDKTTKPKAKPRAVLSLAAKSTSSQCNTAKQFLSSLEAIYIDSLTNFVPEFLQTQTFVSSIELLNTANSRLPHGRSPPLC